MEPGSLDPGKSGRHPHTKSCRGMRESVQSLQCGERGTLTSGETDLPSNSASNNVGQSDLLPTSQRHISSDLFFFAREDKAMTHGMTRIDAGFRAPGSLTLGVDAAL